jgi:hypothetical protein
MRKRASSQTMYTIAFGEEVRCFLSLSEQMKCTPVTHFVEDEHDARKWRSLTRAYIDISFDGWIKEAMYRTIFIMEVQVAGWTMRTPEDLSQIEKMLSSILKALRDLRNAASVEATSVDLVCFAAYRGDKYMPKAMRDLYAEWRRRGRG